MRGIGAILMALGAMNGIWEMIFWGFIVWDIGRGASSWILKSLSKRWWQ